MNSQLASDGWPWLIIHVEDRKAYFAALEAASVSKDIRPFAEFICQRLAGGRPIARLEPSNFLLSEDDNAIFSYP